MRAEAAKVICAAVIGMSGANAEVVNFNRDQTGTIFQAESPAKPAKPVKFAQLSAKDINQLKLESRATPIRWS